LIKLDRWVLGGYIFHEPVDRIEHAAHSKLTAWWRPESGGKPRGSVQGYVEHRRYRGHWPSECAYWLFLIFRPRVFFKTFGHGGHSYPRTPMCIVANAIFWWTMHVKAMEQWHFNPYNSVGDWKGTLFGTCQLFETQRRGRAMNRSEMDIPF
jgi:hypothetical protein